MREGTLLLPQLSVGGLNQYPVDMASEAASGSCHQQYFLLLHVD